MAALIDELAGEGVRRAFVWMRHGHRHYDAENPDNERFMGLTSEGKQAALEFGRRLPALSPVRLFSSSIGRCIETAYQVEKGCIERGVETRVNKLAGRLTGFFVRDVVGSLVHMRKVGKDRFFRRWFAGELPTTIMQKLPGIFTSTAPWRAGDRDPGRCRNLAAPPMGLRDLRFRAVTHGGGFLGSLSMRCSGLSSGTNARSKTGVVPRGGDHRLEQRLSFRARRIETRGPSGRA
ncbi:MAG: histidine phosphatase family protein [Myxococcales bacterium]|nr:histidine phosphatase family protein [Myxococcales bacterium]